MKLFRWNKGRQNTGYETLPICMFKYFDTYLIRYKQGDAIPSHVDKAFERDHYRLNIVLWNTATGGNFHCDNMILESKRIKFFRPDLHSHSVGQIYSGTRLVLSIGFAIINKMR